MTEVMTYSTELKKGVSCLKYEDSKYLWEVGEVISRPKHTIKTIQNKISGACNGDLSNGLRSLIFSLDMAQSLCYPF